MLSTTKKPVVLSISLTSILLALALVLDLISQSLKVFNFLNINLSLFVAFICFFVLSFRYLNLFLVSKLIILTFSVNSSGFLIHFVGVLISILAQFFIIYLYYLFHIAFKRVLKTFLTKNKVSLFSRILNHWFFNFLFIYILAAIVSSLLLITLNTLLFNVIYFYLFGSLKSISLSELIAKYDNFKIFFFGINNYFLGSFALYFTFNLLNYVINGTLLEIVLILEKQTQFLTKYIVIYTNNKY